MQLDELTDHSGSSSDKGYFEPFDPVSRDFNFVLTPNGSSANNTPPPLKWVDESRGLFVETKPVDTSAKRVSPDDIDIVRKRLKKRRSRPHELSDVAVLAADKRARNTLAARRYRERQRKDIDILDARVKQLEEELNSAKLEIMRWKMESERWKDEAERSRNSR